MFFYSSLYIKTYCESAYDHINLTLNPTFGFKTNNGKLGVILEYLAPYIVCVSSAQSQPGTLSMTITA